jgi:predicted secreted protein
MSVQRIKRLFVDLIREHQPMDSYELRRIFTEAIREWELEQGWGADRKGDRWTDEELRVILSDAPTKENCLKHARGFNRGYGAIEQIYRWAAATDARIKAERAGDTFIAQIKRVAKQLGWRA